MSTERHPIGDREREMQWINSNHSRYAGQWVVVEGGRLIVADADGEQAFLAAKAAGIEVPFLVHVLAEESLPFVAGW